MAEGGGASGSGGGDSSGMDPAVWAALIGAASSAIGSGFGYAGAKLTQGQRQDQRWLNYTSELRAQRAEELAFGLTHNQVRWRTEDAMRAGLHPLAALGINPSSGPSVMGASLDSSGSRGPNGFDLASDLSHGLGQNISRAMMAQKSAEDRALAAAILKRTNSESDLAQAQAAESRGRTMNQPGNPPPVPQMDMSNQYQLLKRPDGSWEWVMSPQRSQAIMSDPIKMWSSSLENAFAGPETRPFWRSVGRGARRLAPWNLRESIRGGN